MPSFGDSIFIFVLALMLFGPKRLPQLARQLGKLMGEFRRASNEFRMQMEDELRISEQQEHQKKIDALAPPPSQIEATMSEPDLGHPHLPAPEPVPIAESGSLKMMPPSTGLPVGSSTDWSMASSNGGVIATPEEPVAAETEHTIHTDALPEHGEQAAHG